jgi:hypothetical protein
MANLLAVWLKVLFSSASLFYKKKEAHRDVIGLSKVRVWAWKDKYYVNGMAFGYP